MRKLKDMRFFQVVKYTSATKADMQKIEEYYDEFVDVIHQESKNPNDLIDFYNQQNYIFVELEERVKNLDYIDENLPKNKCIKKALKLLEKQMDLTKYRIKVSLKKSKNQESTDGSRNEGTDWTSSDVDLVELGYALIAAKCINNGNIDIKELMTALCQFFGNEVKDIYRTYHSIKQRVGDRTIFIDKLKNRLMIKMDNDDNK